MDPGGVDEAGALAWAASVVDGPVTITPVKARRWASCWRFSGPSGVVYLKAGASATRYEGPLMAALAAADAARVPAVLALAPVEGWVLLADAGPTVRETTPVEAVFDVAAWRSIMTRFAQLQRAAEPLVPELLAAGVPDERRIAGLLENSPLVGNLTVSERRRLREEHQSWVDDATRLERLAAPPSVQHGDLHDGNVSIGDDGQVRFFDFGDASVSHPFMTVFVALRVARSRQASQADLSSLCEAYLDGYADLAPRPALREGLTLALRIAPVLRVTSWDRALAGPAPPGDTGRWEETAISWLREIIAR